MENFLATLNNPYALTAVLVLSIVSTVYLLKGFKEGDVPKLLVGLGTMLPTFDIFSWKTWGAGVAACAFGFWLQSKMDAI